ncbi:GNAT family N-acetyltransferase [Amycolatopsis anabasis]|uniref:GNAT family N-acetyltransferase n=1 Tax=Amycolatopsis anabasis TaxID=1840409 RepID=UPI00131E75DA|nr:GNAT family N-acetyltransferase [Amycolatopsis anabasis]
MDPVRAQSTRFAALDPLLPPAREPPSGDRLTARTADGREVFGVLYRRAHRSAEAMWSPPETWELTPVLGDTGGRGLDALLTAWRARLRRDRPGAESACVLAWPSRDAEAVRVLLNHGLVPESALAVRGPDPADAPPRADLTVREASAADLEELVDLELAELRYAALLGRASVPADAAEKLAPGIRGNLSRGRVWLAERGGLTVGMAACRPVSTVEGSTLTGRLPDGRWGFVRTVSVAPAARGNGVGRTLMAVAHRELNGPGTRGTFLFYNPINPLSPVFWHRQGYRPLWTIWSIGPATALR